MNTRTQSIIRLTNHWENTSMAKNRVLQNIYELITSVSDLYPENTAITFIETVSPALKDTRISYREFGEMMNQTARLIHRELGGRRGVVALLLPNIPQAQAILWGGSAVSIIQPLNLLMDEETLVSMLDSAGAEILFSLGPNQQPGVWEKTLAIASRAKTIRKVYSVLDADESGIHPHYDTEILKESVKPLPQAWLPDKDEIASYFHTGGTTGAPKLAMLSHHNHIVCALSRSKYSGLKAGEVIINGLPIFHVGGTTLNSLAMMAGGINIILPTIDGYRNVTVIQNFWRLVEHYSIASNICAPASMAAILQVPVGDADISSLRISASGGAVVPDVIADGVLKITGHPLLQIYAMTETSGLTALPSPHVDVVKGCAGWIPPEVEIRIGDGSMATGEAGEICIRSEAVFKGYLSHPQDPLDEDGWLASGDLGYVDESGRLFITGRSKDLIIRSGHNIDPVGIEACLEKHPAVQLSAAVGKPDSYAGELPVAYVQLKESLAVTPTPDELLAFAMENINERPACPKQIFILDALPLTAVGKIHKPTLRENAARLVVKEALGEQFSALEVAVSAEIVKTGEMHIKVQVDQAPSELQALLEKLQSELKLVIGLKETCTP
jgi:fatty-acyl-CoA synthase